MKRVLTLATLTTAFTLAACGGSQQAGNNPEAKAQTRQAVPRAKTGTTNSSAPQASDYQAAVQYLYLAYFGRPADPAGLSNFENALLAANAPTDIASLGAAYGSNPAVKSLIDSFSSSKESQTLYGGGNSSAFVSAVFQNVLGRAPQAGGLSYWSTAIDSGSLSQGNAALSIMIGALANQTAQGLLDAQLIGQRLNEAESFTAQVSLQGATSAYAGASAAASARSLLGTVTATTDPLAFSTSIDSTLGSLLGPSIELLAGGTGGPGANDGNVAVAHFSAFNYRTPAGIWADASGNLFVADTNNDTIRKITPAGVVSTVAGTPPPYYTNSSYGLGSPAGAVTDSQGNLYIADGSQLSKLTPDGTYTVVSAKFGVSQPNPDLFGLPTLYANLTGIAIDAADNIYIADAYGNSIYKVTPDGMTTNFAGTPNTTGGAADGTGTAASFSSPAGMTVDGSGNLYVADSKNGVVRKISPAGVVTTVQAGFSQPAGVALDAAGNLYVTEAGENIVSVLPPSGIKATLAGRPTSNSPNVTGGYSDGMGSAAQFKQPQGITIGADGNLYVVDTGNDAIRKITPAGAVTTLAGSPPSLSWADGTGATASFIGPSGVAVDGSGNVYVTDYSGYAVRKITPAGVTTTLAGTPSVTQKTAPNGQAGAPFLPAGIAVDENGNVYYADISKLTKIAPDGGSTVVASNTAGQSNPGQMIGLAPQVAIDKAGNFYLTDSVLGFLHKVTPAGVISEVTNAQGVNTFYYSAGVAIDTAGNIYVSDSYNSNITKIATDGTFSILAGSYRVSGHADGTGSNATFNGPGNLAVDAAGNVYVADSGNNAVRKITPAGVVTTVIGKGGIQGTVLGALPGGLSSPAGLAIDKNGILYVTSGNGVLKVKLP